MRQQAWQQGGRHSLRCIVDEEKQGGAQLEQKGQGGIPSLRGPEESKKGVAQKDTFNCKDINVKDINIKSVEVKYWR